MKNWLKEFKERRQEREMYNRSVRELEELDDRALADLGLHRGNIREVMWSEVLKHRERRLGDKAS